MYVIIVICIYAWDSVDMLFYFLFTELVVLFLCLGWY